MPDTKISAAQAAAAVTAGQEFGINDGGVSRKVNAGQLRAFINGQTLNSTSTLAFPNDANANPVFAATLTLQPGDYFFEGLYEITGMGATTRTTATLFGGTATITAIRYFAMIQTGAANALGTAQSTKSCVTRTANVLNSTATTAAECISVNGIVRVSVAGTFIPQVQHSANPTGTILVAANSFFNIWQ